LPDVNDHDEFPEDPLAADEAVVNPREKPMGFFDHLEDLRWTLIKCAVVFAGFVALIAFNLRRFAYLLSRPLEQVQAEYPALNTELITNSPMGVFSVIISICLLGGFLLALPFCLFFIGQFVAPALTQREVKLLLPTAGAGLGLFLLGASFGYFLIVPSTLRISFELNELLGYNILWTADKYYSLLLWLVLGLGAAFEFPLLIVLANLMGLVAVATLRKYRRHSIVLMFIIAAIITPTPAMINQTLIALPLIALYELSILVAARMERRRAAPAG
jgi:sec-independent protein translocase protein TatC